MRLNVQSFLAQIDPSEVDLPNKDPISEGIVGDILPVLFGAAGAVALIIITIAAFKYVISQGDPQNTAKARNTIIYALVGLVIVIMAYVIVTFVVNNL